MTNPRQAEQLALYATALRASPHNLVSRTALEELEARHLPECVALAHLLPAAGAPSQLVDVGSGGGLPGLVIAILRPDLKVTLVESRRKKATFLSETAQTLGLTVTVLPERIEDIIRHRSGSWDLATARAVAPMDRLAGLTLPLLRTGGLLYAVKGDRWEEEVEAAEDAIRRNGGRVVANPRDLSATDPHTPKTVIVTKDH